MKSTRDMTADEICDHRLNVGVWFVITMAHYVTVDGKVTIARSDIEDTTKANVLRRVKDFDDDWWQDSRLYVRGHHRKLALEDLKGTWKLMIKNYVPTSDDDPKRNNWYARFYASSALLDLVSLDIDPRFNIDWSHLVHSSTALSDEQSFEQWLIALKHFAPSEPEKPNWSCRYDPRPQPHIETRAKELFRKSFKEKWPDKRINCKFAKDKWAEVMEKCTTMAENEFRAKYDKWVERERAHNEKQEKMTAEYDKALDEYQHIQKIIKVLEKEVA